MRNFMFDKNERKETKDLLRHPELDSGSCNSLVGSQIPDRSNSGLLTFAEFVPSGMTNNFRRKKVAFTLAEGATHAGTWKGSRKSAFTLAEVLITLGVIGVVAAMTMPTLIKNYQKKTWTTQLQKTYSILEQGFQKMMADDGVDKLSDTAVWASKGTTGCGDEFGTDFSTNTDCKNYFENFKKYFKVIGYEKYEIREKWLNGYNDDPSMYNSYTVILSDGAMIKFNVYGSPVTKTSTVCNTIKSLGGNMCSEAGHMYIDVNGRKGPNTLGRDIFKFRLSDEGKLYPTSGKDVALYFYQTALDSNWAYWRNNNQYCGNLDGSLPAASVAGDDCAGRIIENGWKMDY